VVATIATKDETVRCMSVFKISHLLCFEVFTATDYKRSYRKKVSQVAAADLR
jgi:hypothetical protein